MAGQWYVVRTEPMAEYIAADGLARDGFEVFLPSVKSATPRRGHTEVPLFPGYLLLKCDPLGQVWPTFRSSHRLYGWVKFGNDMPSIPDEVVDELARRIDTLNNGAGLWSRFGPGDIVRVVFGAMDSDAEVLEGAKTSSGKTKVLLEFMGRLISAKVPWESLRETDNPIENSSISRRKTRGGGRWINGQRPRAIAHA